MQAKGNTPPVGAVFDAAFSRSEHVLAMGVMYKLQTLRELRVASLSVSRADLRAVALCDALARYFTGPGSRNIAPVAMSSHVMQALAAAPMVEAILRERTPAGEARYPQGIVKLNDTAEPAALIRNGISAQQPGNAVLIVAGPLSNVAAAMALPDVRDLVPKRVRSLVIAATVDDIRADLPAARKVLAEWAAPIAFVEASELAFPAGQLEARFAWAPNHPVREAYKAFQTMPYDAPLSASAAVLYAARPTSEMFTTSGAGTLEVADTGIVSLQPSGSGTRKTVRIAANQQDAALQALVDLIAAQPAAPAAGRGGRGGPPQQ